MALINELSQKFRLFSPVQAPHHRPTTHPRDALPLTEAQQTQPGPLDLRTQPLYGWTRLYGFMALINEISQKFPLYFHQPKLRITAPTYILGMPHLSPRHNEPNPVR